MYLRVPATRQGLPNSKHDVIAGCELQTERCKARAGLAGPSLRPDPCGYFIFKSPLTWCRCPETTLRDRGVPCGVGGRLHGLPWLPDPRRCPKPLAHPHPDACLIRARGPAHPAKEALKRDRALPCPRGAAALPPRRPAGLATLPPEAGQSPRTLAMRIIRLAMSRSPWWFCPISAMMKHGCSPPMRRPGQSSNSRDMMAATPPLSTAA